MKGRSVDEAADILGLCTETVYRLCASGRLAHGRFGVKPGRGRIRISDESLAAFVRSCEVSPEDAPAAPKNMRARQTRIFSGRPDGKPLEFF